MKRSIRIFSALLGLTILSGCFAGDVTDTTEQTDSAATSSQTSSEGVYSDSSKAPSSQASSQPSSQSSSSSKAPSQADKVPSSEPSSTVSSSSSSKPQTPPEESVTADTVRHWVQWTGGPVRPDGLNSAWDWKAATRQNVNQLSVHYLAEDEDGETVYGVPTVDQCAALMKRLDYDLKESAKAGVDILGFCDTVQISRRAASNMGYSLSQLCAVDASGNYIFTTAWHAEGLYICCINSPQWRAWLTEIHRLHAEAGFAGVQFDFHPYAAAGLFCRCKNCQASWKAYSKEKLGVEKELLTQLDFSNEISRTYFWWKMECFADFLKEVSSEAKKVNPDYKLAMNNNVNGYNFPFEALLKGWDVPTSEHHNSNNGYSSTLYMYQLTEALGYDILHSQYNTWPEVDPIFRYKTNLAEAYATIGGISYVTDATGWGKKMFRFVSERPEIYAGSSSKAGVAVLYSAESNVFSLKPNELNLGSLLFTFRTDRARQAASALVKSGVTYDFLAVERADAEVLLDRYGAFVIPAYTYFNDDTWAPIIEKLVRRGKRMIVIGEGGKQFITQNAGNCTSVTYVPALKAADSEEAFQVTDEFKAAVAGLSNLTLMNNLSDTALTIRESGSKTYIHVVRRGAAEADRATHHQWLRWTIPEGKKITSISAECPYTSKKSIDLDWTVYNGILEIITDDFDTYLVITIS
ncbi:MAG: hypothetical protein IJY82_07395 [Oscillospiraceae bacterium]|nr:hypothetical protein [Oscillospiraceae bacterium]